MTFFFFFFFCFSISRGGGGPGPLGPPPGHAPAFVYPYLIYGVEIWGNACNAYIDPLIKLQKKCLRIITFSNYLAHTEPLFQKLEI